MSPDIARLAAKIGQPCEGESPAQVLVALQAVLVSMLALVTDDDADFRDAVKHWSADVAANAGLARIMRQRGKSIHRSNSH